ncbi:methyltransferase domain-containing protein [Streptomyces sp. NPDC093252]|uniref:class I SAM-dependent methyltransferase n=1 Tax=Streptomyces sp. NPDC093252 TaxID=3154980 RepID=UPI00343D6C49
MADPAPTTPDAPAPGVPRAPTANTPTPDTPYDPTPDRTYWNTRHRHHDTLASGGHIGLDRPGNEIFYALRLGALLPLLGDLADPTAPLFVLDAGCGKGHFARALARCGHRVDAFDTSEAAVTEARAQARAEAGTQGGGGGAPRYAVAALDEWRSPWLYDAVLSLDVLFHVLDDDEWAAALRNLASLVRITGRLIVTDENGAARRPRGTYIVHRPAADYTAVLTPLGLGHTGFTPYGFRENEVGFHVFTRTR